MQRRTDFHNPEKISQNAGKGENADNQYIFLFSTEVFLSRDELGCTCTFHISHLICPLQIVQSKFQNYQNMPPLLELQLKYSTFFSFNLL